MSSLLERPVLWIIILCALTSALMRAFPTYMGAGKWIMAALFFGMGAVMAARPERSGLGPNNTIGVRLAGIFILLVWAVLVARDLIHFKGA